ncbi:hypothetical protein ACR3K2_30200 [Cryptosporidium serpentis]
MLLKLNKEDRKQDHQPLYYEYYKFRDNFVRNNNTEISAIDISLRNMLNESRKIRREIFLNEKRISLITSRNSIENNLENENNKIIKKNSRYIKEWNLALTWSSELVKYNYLTLFTWDTFIKNYTPGEWLVTPITIGIRCILIYGNGYCEIRDEHGWTIFVIDIPPFKHSGLTILDGIYNYIIDTFICYDVIEWNNLKICDSSTDCRLYFLRSRFQEIGLDNYNNRIEIENEDILIDIRNDLSHIKHYYPYKSLNNWNKEHKNNIKIQMANYFEITKQVISSLYLKSINAIENNDMNKFLSFFAFVHRESCYNYDYSCYWYIWRDYNMKPPGILGNLFIDSTKIKKKKGINKKLKKKNYNNIQQIITDMDAEGEDEINMDSKNDGISFILELRNSNDLYTSENLYMGNLLSLHPENENKISLEIFNKNSNFRLVRVFVDSSQIEIFMNNFNQKILLPLDSNIKGFTGCIFGTMKIIGLNSRWHVKADSIDYILFQCTEFFKKKTEIHLAMNDNNNTVRNYSVYFEELIEIL